MIISLAFWIIAFIVAITVHEAAHAATANKLGDPTPKLMGRLTLNPIAHYDPVGTTLLLALVVLRAFGVPVIPFGWAKPVQFDPYNLKNPRRDAALISIAGPMANIATATVLALILRFITNPFTPFSLASALIEPIITLNVILAIFNLIPIHPLDGGKILVGLLPREQAIEADTFMKRYGMIMLFFLIFPTFGGTSPIFIIISPILRLIFNLLIPGSQVV